MGLATQTSHTVGKVIDGTKNQISQNEDVKINSCQDPLAQIYLSYTIEGSIFEDLPLQTNISVTKDNYSYAFSFSLNGGFSSVYSRKPPLI